MLGKIGMTCASWIEKREDIPRLSAAIMMPSLYLIARTLVPVTMGCLKLYISLYSHVFHGKRYCVRCTLSANPSFDLLLGRCGMGYVP